MKKQGTYFSWQKARFCDQGNVENWNECLWHLAWKLKSHWLQQKQESPKRKEKKKPWSEILDCGGCYSTGFSIRKWFAAEITFKINSRLFTSTLFLDFQLKDHIECVFYYSRLYCKPGRMRPSWSWGTSLRLIFIFSLYNFNCEFQSPARTRAAPISYIKKTSLCCPSDHDTQLRFHLWTARTLTRPSLRSRYSPSKNCRFAGKKRIGCCHEEG